VEPVLGRLAQEVQPPGLQGTQEERHPSYVEDGIRPGDALGQRLARLGRGQVELGDHGHRPDLGGLVGPNLTDDLWLHGCTAGDLVRDVRTGFPQKGMLPFGTGKVLSDEQVLQLVSYVISKRGSNPPNPKAADPERDAECRQ